MKRLGIFFFYDKDGVADRYVDYLLSDINQCLDRLVIVSNGTLTKETKEMFGRHTQAHGRQEHCLIERKNDGFDVWAYRTALMAEGWEGLEKYDEVVLFNHTIMGPLYPFQIVFEKMEENPVDFWGITEHFGWPTDPSGESPYGYLPVHLQSHFIVCRRSLIKSDIFRDYWENMPEISSYTDSVGKHESYFTQYFADHGFHGEAYTNLSPLCEKTEYPLIILPVSSIMQFHSPIFKRKSFFCEAVNFYGRGSGALEAQQLFRYLKENTDYDTSMIVENMIRTCHQSDYSVYLDTVLRMNCPKKAENCDSNIRMVVIVTDQDDVIAEELLRKVNSCRIERLEEDAKGFTVEKLLSLAEETDYICVLHMPMEYPPGYEFGFIEYRDELYKEFLADEGQNLDYLFNAFSKDPMLGLVVAARLVTLDYAVISAWENLFAKNVLIEDQYFDRNKIPQGAGLPFFIAKGSALAACRRKLNSWLLDVDLLETGCVDLIVSLLVQEGGYLTKSVLLDSVCMANTTLQTCFYTGWKEMEQAACGEITLYKNVIADFPFMRVLKIKMKKRLPKKIYSLIVKLKRFLFGPREMRFSYDEYSWENVMEAQKRRERR